MTIQPLFAVPAGPEMLILVFIVVLLFGAQKIPKLARSTGEAIGEFKRGAEESKQELEEIQEEVEEEVEEVEETAKENPA